MTDFERKVIALNTEAIREMVERNALAIDPDARLADWPQALAFQIEMARVVIRETVETCAKVVETDPIGRIATLYDWTKSVGQDLAGKLRALTKGEE